MEKYSPSVNNNKYAEALQPHPTQTLCAHEPGPLTAGLPCALTEVLWLGWAGSWAVPLPFPRSRCPSPLMMGSSGTVVSHWVPGSLRTAPARRFCWGRWGGVIMLHWKHPQSVNPSLTPPRVYAQDPCWRNRGSCPCSEGLGNRELRTPPGEGEEEVGVVKASPTCGPLSHWTSLGKLIFKDRIIKNLKMVTTEHEFSVPSELEVLCSWAGSMLVK